MSRVNEHYYNLIADDFAAYRSKSKVDKEVINLGKLLKIGDRILSVGCGSGEPNERYLDTLGFRIFGIDISEKLISLAKKNVKHAEFLLADIATYETNEQFSAILAWWSLFHLQPSEHAFVFEKIYRFLKPGGYLLFNHGGEAGEIRSKMFGEEFYYSSLDPEHLQELVEQIGFSVLEWHVVKTDGNNHMVGLLQKP